MASVPRAPAVDASAGSFVSSMERGTTAGGVCCEPSSAARGTRSRSAPRAATLAELRQAYDWRTEERAEGRYVVDVCRQYGHERPAAQGSPDRLCGSGGSLPAARGDEAPRPAARDGRRARGCDARRALRSGRGAGMNPDRCSEAGVPMGRCEGYVRCSTPNCPRGELLMRHFSPLLAYSVLSEGRDEIGSAYCGVSLAGARCIRRRRSTGFGHANRISERFCERRCHGLFDERGPKWVNIGDCDSDPGDESEREERPPALRSTGQNQAGEV